MDFHKVHSSTFFSLCLKSHKFAFTHFPCLYFPRDGSFKYYNYPANKTDQEKEHRQQMLRENAANTNGNKSCEER